MNCKVCKGHAVVDVRRHNAAFCSDHFVEHARNQVARAIKEFKMFDADEGLLDDGTPDARTVLVRKVKPLVPLAERETAAYALLKGIDYVVEECPMVEGNTHHRYKDALTQLEERSPGTKQQMYFGFLKKAAHRFADEADDVEFVACVACGALTVAGGDAVPRCVFCRTKALAGRRRYDRRQVAQRRPRGR